MRAGGSRLLGVAPRELVYGSAFRRCQALVIRGETDCAFVRGYQTTALRALLASALAGSEFYREHLPAGFDPSVFAVEDLRGLPVMARGEVATNCERMLAVPAARVDEVTTGGSSGVPLRVFLDKDRSPKEWAFDTRVWMRAGYSLGSRRAVLRGLHIANVDAQPWEWEPGLRELRLSPFHLTETHVRRYLTLLERYCVDYVHGYPSAITILARHAQRIGWTPPGSLKGVLPISEPLFAHQRELFGAVFRDPVIAPFYGLSEKVCMAGEVAGHEGVYEFEPLYGIAELVGHDDKPVERPGEVGRIIGTGLLSTGMPLIRYDTGDTARLVDLPTAENCYRLRVDQIAGRWGREFLVARSGALLSTAAINVHSPAYALVREFQFYQDTPGEAVLRLAPVPGVPSDEARSLATEMQRKVGRGLQIRAELVDEIPTSPRGKRPLVDQRLNLADFGPLPFESPVGVADAPERTGATEL